MAHGGPIVPPYSIVCPYHARKSRIRYVVLARGGHSEKFVWSMLTIAAVITVTQPIQTAIGRWGLRKVGASGQILGQSAAKVKIGIWRMDPAWGSARMNFPSSDPFLDLRKSRTGHPPSGQLPTGGWPGARAGWLAARVHPVSLRILDHACMI